MLTQIFDVVLVEADEVSKKPALTSYFMLPYAATSSVVRNV
jgi:hypothetical protein